MWSWDFQPVTTLEMLASDALVGLCFVFMHLSWSPYQDIDQCSVDNGGCDQNCTDLIPGRKCSCVSGYELGSDGLSCNGQCYGIAQ